MVRIICVQNFCDRKLAEENNMVFLRIRQFTKLMYSSQSSGGKSSKHCKQRATHISIIHLHALTIFIVSHVYLHINVQFMRLQNLMRAHNHSQS